MQGVFPKPILPIIPGSQEEHSQVSATPEGWLSFYNLHRLPALLSQGETDDVSLASDISSSESDTADTVLDIIRACTNHTICVGELVSFHVGIAAHVINFPLNV